MPFRFLATHDYFSLFFTYAFALQNFIVLFDEFSLEKKGLD
jgi:hypothetical protein